ncbi:sensor histidine kinase [bacterium D16-51]|nr:sensor histidine kinase [bacterium D16-59]RKI62366.1 sensor histidine kinase [bacterium D16-51]
MEKELRFFMGTLRQKKRHSVKRVFFYYVFVMFTIVLVLSGIAVRVCINMRDKIIASHAYVYGPGFDMTGEDENIDTYGYTIPPENSSEQNGADTLLKKDLQEFTDRDKLLCHIFEILMFLLPFLFLCTGIWIAGSVFYTKKLKEPFYLLNQGIAHIEQGDLDFSLEYSGQDELGNLCRAFETMRQKVLENNTEMWNMAEERKKLNASVAHDLRTPITVIKGYSEYLIRNLQKDTLLQKNIVKILSYIQNAAGRLEAYADSVYHIHMLENLDLEYCEADLSLLSAEIISVLRVISEKFDRTICVSSDLPEEKVFISVVTVFRIMENIVQNACYYSKKNISVELGKRNEYLEITVIDDGDGFSERSMDKAFAPYYKEEGKEEHYGMGLAVCKILSRKHGGDILLSNDEDKGAKVFVKLKMRGSLEP